MLQKLILLIIFLGILSACKVETESNEAPVSEDQNLGYLDVNLYKLNKLVCDPFNPGDNPTNIKGGLAAELFYRKDGQERFYSAIEYIEQGQASDSHIFFNQLNVPTRRFELGFPTETGDILKSNEGAELVEYFGLRFKTFLSLDDTQEEGYYQVAILSDDGTVMKYLNENQELVTLVDNDGDHPTKMGCANDIVYFDRNTKLPVEIDYYQGPRFHISIVPMWRKVNPEDANDPLCGQQGNSKFFDFNNNSEPQPAYHDLISRGWRPWNSDNHTLPDQYIHNPCAGGQPPEITGFSVSPQPGGFLTATWSTDIPATAQLLITQVSSGAETVTDSDNTLRTNHSVQAEGLQAGVQYKVQPIAISADYGKTVGDPVYIIFEF